MRLFRKNFQCKFNLINANPDLIISQETCEVCAAYTNQINLALEILPKKPQLYSMDPHNLKEILVSVTKLGQILKKEEKAVQIVNSLQTRIQNLQNLGNEKIPRVLAIEWIEPFFTAGHWIPEMIEISGGINLISKIDLYSDMVLEVSNPQGIRITISGLDSIISSIFIRLECSPILLIKLIPPEISIISGIQ